MSNVFYVYQYLDPTTNAPLYIGKGKGERYLMHLRYAEKHVNPRGNVKFIEHLRDMIADGKRPIVEIVQSDMFEDDAFRLEEALIAQYKRRLDGGTLYNIWLKNGGKSTPMTEEAKQHLRNTHKGRKITWGARISESLRGKTIPLKTRERMAAAQLGSKNHTWMDVDMTVLLKLRETMTIDQIAREMEISRSTVKRRLAASR